MLDDLAKPLIHLFEAKKQTMRLFEFVIRKEVERTKTESTLFRSNSLASKMMTHYTSMTGTPFLVQVLKDPMIEIINKNENLEVDPNRMSNADESDGNLKKLRELAQQFLDRILDSLDKTPLYSFRFLSQL